MAAPILWAPGIFRLFLLESLYLELDPVWLRLVLTKMGKGLTRSLLELAGAGGFSFHSSDTQNPHSESVTQGLFTTEFEAPLPTPNI